MSKFYQTKILLCFVLALSNCTSKPTSEETVSEVDSLKIELFDHYIIPYNFKFQNTTVGGLSSIDFAGNGVWYIISDDRSEYDPARFYKVQIAYNLNGIDSVKFVETMFMKNELGAIYSQDALDPEAIRYNRKSQTLFYSSEGGRQEATLSPFVREMDTLGNFIKEYNVPPQFDFFNGKGVRKNGAFESLAFENDTILWYANELPLMEDGEVPQYENTISPIRLSQLDVKNNQPMKQFAYMIDPVQALPDPADGFNINSVVELLVLDSENFLVMERSYIIGVGNFVKVFKATIADATDVSDFDNLKNSDFTAVEKELLINFSDYNLGIDNIEGMTFGPDLEDGRKSLVCISDNNFNETQQTQIWIFAIQGL